jgi:hypothetical protein
VQTRPRTGAYFAQGRTVFGLPKEHEATALAALKQADREHGLTGYARSPVQLSRSLQDAIAAIGWRVHRDAEGAISGIVAQEPRKCFEDAEIRLLDALAPFVVPGSSIVLERYGLDEPPYLHTFDGKKRSAKKIDKSDPRVRAEPSAGQAQEGAGQPAWSEAKKTMPAVGLKIYSMAESYQPGQWIAHPKLGPGLVLGVVEGNKVRVLFESGERRLAQGMT